jgi:hypothetical protein
MINGSDNGICQYGDDEGHEHAADEDRHPGGQQVLFKL